VTAPPRSRNHVETDVSSRLRQLRSELMPDDNGPDVLLPLHEPQLADRHAPELSNRPSVTHESVEVSSSLLEIRIGDPLLGAHVPFPSQVRVFDR
jgi:hypothetical protein